MVIAVIRSASRHTVFQRVRRVTDDDAEMAGS